MYPSMSRYHRALISMLLLVSMDHAESVKMNTERRLADSSDPDALGSPVESPYWEYVLREFLFKTISPPPPANNILYKELLEAPFYSGPFPAPETFNDGETAQVLSRGDVYHLVNGGWIICQEGCKDCEICTMQKMLIIPTVKWILRRIERYVQFPHSKRHDLQLTVLPQADGGFHMKNLSPGSYVYVTSNNGALADFSDTLIRKNKEYNSLRYPFGTTKSPGGKNPGDIFHSNEETDKELDEAKVVTEEPNEGPETENEIFRTETQLKITSTSIPKTPTVPVRKRGREVLQDGENRWRIDELEDNRGKDSEHSSPTENSTPLTLFYPPTDLPMVQKIDADCGTRKDTKLILGRDQFGDKHIVHVVAAGDLDAGMKKASVHPGARFIHQKPAQPHPFETEYEDRPLYRKIFRRVIDSLNTHKNAIEKFLLSSKLESRLGHGPSSTSTASTFHKEENAVLNHDDDNSTQTASPEVHIENSKGTNDTANDLESASDEEMVDEETSSAPTSTDIPNEEDEDPTGSHHSTVQVTEDEVQESNNDLHNFDDQNSTRSLSDESTKRHNNSETLILKEVAKSVLNHSDTLQGFNPVSNSSIRRDYLRSISDGSTGRTEYLNRRDKSRRHV